MGCNKNQFRFTAVADFRIAWRKRIVRDIVYYLRDKTLSQHKMSLQLDLYIARICLRYADTKTGSGECDVPLNKNSDSCSKRKLLALACSR